MSLYLTVSGSARVVRGGGWYSDPQFARFAFRSSSPPGNRISSLGVRLIRRCP